MIGARWLAQQFFTGEPGVGQPGVVEVVGQPGQERDSRIGVEGRCDQSRVNRRQIAMLIVAFRRFQDQPGVSRTSRPSAGLTGQCRDP